MLIDTHAHLCEEKLFENAESIVNDFESDNIEAIVCPGTDFITNKRTLSLVNRFQNVYGALGLHPIFADKWDLDIRNLIEQGIKNSKIVAIGEIGLDLYENTVPIKIQASTLLEQMNISKLNNLPIIFHVRNAWNEFFEFIRGNRDLIVKGVVHCFDGTVEEMKKILDLGLNISFTGLITQHKEYLWDVIKAIPLDRFMIETDSPYIVPKPISKNIKINEPKNVIYVAEQIANLRGMHLQKVIDIATQNTYEFFERMNINAK